MSSTLQEQFDELRKGRSNVLDKGHTLIVGYHPEKLRSILSELTYQARALRKQQAVVILSTEEKENVESTLADAISYVHPRFFVPA